MESVLGRESEIKREYAPSHLLNDGPIIISIYYGVATFTTTGIGDFVPQSVEDTISSLYWQIYAFFMLGILAARLTSGLASASLPRWACSIVVRLHFCEFIES